MRKRVKVLFHIFAGHNQVYFYEPAPMSNHEYAAVHEARLQPTQGIHIDLLLDT